MQVLLVRQVFESKSITLAWVQVQLAASLIFLVQQHIQR